MSGSREKTAPTRQRLLESSCDVFAEKGYRDATIAEICERAGANIAAVNYHFRDKETLYLEAWGRAFHRSLEAHPPDGGVSEDASPQRRLRARILAFLERITDEKSGEFDILRTELANPTGLLQKAVRPTIKPLKDATGAIIRELLGPAASDTQVSFCLHSVFSQCLHVMFKGRLMKEPDEWDLVTPGRLGEFADHVVKFSLAGIRAVRKDAEARANRRKTVRRKK